MASANTFAARNAERTPAISTGWGRVVRSLHVERRVAPASLVDPSWSSEYVSVGTDRASRGRMSDFGYGADEVGRIGAVADDTAMIGPVKLLSDRGAALLAELAGQLDQSAADNDYVVSRRLRAVDKLSGFVHDMIRDRGFLISVSRLVGVPLMPHPIRDAGVQINYYNAPPAGDPGPPEVAKWHVDGMNYVFTMLLTDHDEYDGGEYVYFTSHRDEFPLRPDAGAGDAEVSHDALATAPFREVGDTMFTRGSRVYHAVTPVTRGHRTTIAFSLFCPFLPGDENRFWHSAPDDGLPRTLRNWLVLKTPGSPASFCRRVGAPLVAWNDLGGDGLQARATSAR